MLFNYLITSVRAIRRHAGYAAINVFGLAIGIAVCLVIAMFIRYEQSYDDFHANSDRIVRIVSDWGDFSVPATSWPLVRSFETDFPEISVARVYPTEAVFGHDGRRFSGDRVLAVTPSFFDIFSFPLLRGEADAPLEKPYTVAITPSAAGRYFGDEDPIGKTVRVNGAFDVEVTSIVAEPPTTSHLDFDVLVSWETLRAQFNYDALYTESWGANGIYTYLLLPHGTAAADIEAELPALIERHAGDDWNGATLHLQPLTSIHLHSNHNMELQANGSAGVLRVFGLIGLLVLLLACVNFMNLATARATERATEVGVRKTIGARREQLVGQFFAESLVMAGLAVLVALLIASAALPVLRAVADVPIYARDIVAPNTIAMLVGIGVASGLLAGSYPAIYLSHFQPSTVLRGMADRAPTAGKLRRGLVVFQFAVSTVLLVGTVVAYLQLGHLRSAPLGFDSQQVVTVPAQNESTTAGFASFRDELKASPHISHASIGSTDLPSELLDGNGYGFADAGLPEDSLGSLRTVSVGHDFFETLGVQVVAGRTFDRDRLTDTSAYVVNEAALRRMQIALPEVNSPAEAVGRRVQAWGDYPVAFGSLIGVVEDFHMATLRETVEPIIFYVRPDTYDTFYLRIDGAAADAAIEDVRTAWNRHYSEWPFEYAFADQRFNASYRSDQRMGVLFATFSGLAIIIACLGLLGLAAFTARQRTKEIGIRKALGATGSQIVSLLTREFAQLVAIAVVVAIPVAYVVMNQWLDTFASRISLGLGVFLIAATVALVTAIGTVSLQAVRAAQTDPGRALRTD
ncbi:ABC transporter permease [Longibacter sp.]|uniref:ABC transporter permease n=1 Tax=Longibacter sp. TaxID=2045415 RepID=UPI003EB99A37